MRVFLNLFLILVSFFACFFEDLYLCVLPPGSNTTMPFTVRFRRPFNFDQEKAFGGKRQLALSKYIPLYTYVPGRAEKTAAELKTLSEEIGALSRRNPSGTKEIIEYFKAGYGLELSNEAARKLLRYKDLGKFIEGILTVQESLLQSKIVEDPQPLTGKDTIEVLYPKPSGIVAFPADEVVTLEAARARLREKVQHLFWQVDSVVRDSILAIAAAAMGPNLIYDIEENYKRIEDIVQRYPSTVISYQPGQVLVRFRHVPSENDLLLVSAYQKEVENDLRGKVTWVLIAVLLTVIFYNLFLEKILKDEWRKDPPYCLYVSQLIVTVLLFKAFLLFTPLPIFALPFGALPLLIVLLNSDKVSATWTALTAAVLVTLFSGCTVSFLLFFAFSGMAAILISLRIRNRIQILLASLAIGATNSLLCLFLSLDWTALFSISTGTWALGLGRTFNPQSIKTLGWAFAGGVATGPLAILLLPLFEISRHTASTFRLIRYADLQQPLLKELLTKTPATYQHSMTVAYLAESVGEAIGANTLLLRIGAYYHDIGKVANPKFYSENQSGGKNPHDDMDPEQSARIIIDHVVNGEKIGREMKLPQVVLDFIIQHHGTQVVEFFYNKAVKNSPGNKVPKKAFQYPGPKPQSVETAVLMICDAVEAASRSLESPTREAIENMVKLLLIKRIADGQFDECHLSTTSLARILTTLVNSLEASFHSRVVYPWQEKQKVRKMRRKAARETQEEQTAKTPSIA